MSTKIIDDLAAQFYLPDQDLLTITHKFLEAFSVGLKEYGHSVAMIPTYVKNFPDGTETGMFLALDLGGDLVRISGVKLLAGEKQLKQLDKITELPPHLKKGDATAFFDFVAEFVGSFLAEKGLQNQTLPLGLNFGFAVQKTSLNKGKLLSWSKGFSVKNAVGKDVLELLQAAFNRKGVPVHCAAILNDTAATLLSKCYASDETPFLGAIFSMGTNGAYVEDVANITKLSGTPAYAAGGKMVVNIEWGGFDNKHAVLPSTSYDVEVDQASNNPGYQAFEKLTAELYLGEIVHKIVQSLVHHSVLFNGVSAPMLDMPGGIITQSMAMIEGGNSIQEVKQAIVDVLEINSVDDVPDEDAAIVRKVCEIVGTRAARLYACAIAAVLVQTGHAQLGGGYSGGYDKLLMAAEGNLIRFYPNFETRLRQALAVVVGEAVEKRVEVGIVKDGSAVGAALAAYAAINTPA